ncbi:unnamed protein product [Knipowitschia caucasica]
MRLCGRMSGSNMELDRCSSLVSVEGSSLRGLGNVSLTTASTDSLADSSSGNAAPRPCSSPFPRSLPSAAPRSPQQNSGDSNLPPPLPEKKMVNRTMSAPDSGKQFIRSYPNLLLPSDSSRSLDPSSRSLDPSSRSLDPSSRSHDPSSRSLDPSSRSLDPSSRSIDPSSRSLDPSSRSLDPSSRSLDPNSRSIDPSSRSIDPSSRSIDPSSRSIDPSSRSIDPSSRSLDPSSRSLDPSSRSLDPSSRSIDPSSRSLDPSSRSLDPSSRSLDPSSRSLDPSPPSSPVDPQSMSSSSECLERHGALGKPSRCRTLDEPLKRRLGVHSRSSLTCSSSPQLSGPLHCTDPGSAPTVGSSLQLQTLLSNIDSREGVYSKLGGLYAESLRRLALKCEDHFTHSQKNPLRFEESNWSLFRLISNKPSCSGGDALYYSAACASDPSHSYAVKICKSPCVEAKQGHLYGLSVLQTLRPHYNLQQDCGHFMACVPQSMLPPEEVTKPTAPPTAPPLERERVVVITPDVPQQTAADFVRQWGSFHKEQPEVYERRVCFLLLQLCNGLEHLKDHGVTHRDLCLENLLLVPHQRRLLPCGDTESSPLVLQRHLPRLLISNFAKAKRRSAEDAAFHSVDPRTKRDHARLAPEIVSAAQYRKFDEFQTGILIYELLHQHNPFEVSPALREQDYRCEDLPSIPSLSLYSDGLQKLAQLLLQPDPIKRIHIQEAKRILQSLLWGPRKELMEQQRERHGQGASLMDASKHEGLLNWLDVKRALLMMKFAERSLEPERNAELEDWLCCQYFSSAHPLCLCHTAELLYA